MTFSEKGRRVQAGVTRRGARILSFKMEFGRSQASPTPVCGIKTFNAGGSPGCVAVNPIWLFKARERIRESYDARATLSLTTSKFDPVAKLVSGYPFNARFVVMDILGGGYFLPVGIAGPHWFRKVHTMRFE